MTQLPDAQLIRFPSALGLAPVLVSGPDALRDILNTKSYEFQKPWGLRAFLARSIGWGLIVSEGAEHRRQRKALQPAFHVWRIRELYGLMWEKTQILLEELEKDVVKQVEGDGYGVVEISEWARSVLQKSLLFSLCLVEYEKLTTLQSSHSRYHRSYSGWSRLQVIDL